LRIACNDAGMRHCHGYDKSDLIEGWARKGRTGQRKILENIFQTPPDLGCIFQIHRKNPTMAHLANGQVRNLLRSKTQWSSLRTSGPLYVRQKV
jgi:hypothetical protein